jgi:outer membrane autotransporter protein
VEVETTNGSNIVRVSGTSAAGLVTFQEGSVTLTAGSGDNDIETDAYGIYNQTSSDISVITGTGTNRIVAPDVGIVSVYGAQTTLKGQTIVESDTALQADGQDEDDSGNPTGDGASIDLQYDGASTIEGDVAAYNKGTITIAPRTDAQQSEQKIDLTGTYLASYQDGTEDPDQFVGGTINLTLTDGSTLTGTTTNASGLVALEDRGTDRMGTINLEMYGRSLWTMTGSSSISTLSGDGGTVHFANGGDHLEITEGVSGSHTYDMDLSYADKTHSDMLYARTGTSDHQTLNVKNLEQLNSEMSAGDAVRYATVQSDAGGGFLGNDYVIVNGLYNDTLTTEYRTVSSDPNRTDTYDADLDVAYGLDDATNIYLVKQETLNDGAVSPSRNRDMIWRYMTTLDTFTKRDGEARYFTDEGKRGAWVRLGYSNLGVDGVGELDGNTYELGWTTVSRQNDERKHRFSASVAYGKPKGQFEGYGGDLTVRDFSVNLYDTHEYYPSAEELANKPEWKKESHAYWDNYLKYHHVKTEYDAYDHVVGTKYSGDYDQNVWNLSTEYGHKLMMNEDWFWVPQAQLQLSYLGSYDYVDSQGLHVDGDSDWSLIGRLGFDLVRDLHDSRNSKIYFKASLLHEFLDGNDVTTSYDGDSYVNEGDQSGTWGVVGLGFSSKIGDKQYFYLDAERYFGNDFERTYDIRAGVNWKF